MQSIKTLLLAATALGFATDFALAQSNEAFIEQGVDTGFAVAVGNDNEALVDQSGGQQNETRLTQVGNDNDASITQSGDNNFAGALIGSAARNLTQRGNQNSLTIDQSGNNNTVGLQNGLRVQQGATTFSGRGDSNEASIEQSSNGNAVGGFSQLSASTTIVETRPTNTIAIVQGGEGANTVSFVYQSNSANGATNSVNIGQIGTENLIGNATSTARAIEQIGTGNDAEVQQGGERNIVTTIQQTGADNSAFVGQVAVGIRGSGSDNTVETIRQIGGNQATVRQADGTGNILTLIDQTNTVGGVGTANSATVSQFGTDNGTTAFAALAGSVGAIEATVLQVGTNNALTRTEIGNRNVSGFAQLGAFNTASGTMSGDDNSLGMYVDGDSNIVFFGQSGDNNDAGIRIIGDDNSSNTIAGNPSAIRQNGDDNLAYLEIVGSSNAVGIRQDTSDSGATLRIDGDGNNATIQQTGIGFHTALLTINGNDNGVGTFSGASLNLVAANAPGGLLGQSGFDNGATLSITGDGNLFNVSQSGDRNTLTADTNGNMNQMAVIQSSAGNVAALTQTGNGNIAAISQ